MPRPPRPFAALLIGACLVSIAVVPPTYSQTLVNAHVSSGGVQGNANIYWSDTPSLSDDGVHVAFASNASNLVAGASGLGDVFVHDNVTGTTVLISKDAMGGPANGNSGRPWLSADGRYVVFQSSATDLVVGDANGKVDVFRHDRDTDADGIYDEPGATATIIVSVTNGGGPSNGHSRCYRHSVSDDGNRIAFESEGTNLVVGDTNGLEDSFVRDVAAGTTERVSLTAAGAQSTCAGTQPAISGNGLVVAFLGSCVVCDLVPGDGPNCDLYARNLATSTTVGVSVSTSGAFANEGSSDPALSDDGNRIVFESMASNLVAGDTNGGQDIFVRTLTAGTTIRCNVANDGTQAVGSFFNPAISGDGNVVGFSGPALDPATDTNGMDDVFVRHLVSGHMERASRTPTNGQGDFMSTHSTLSEDGSSVAFLSHATNLVTPDANGFTPDILVRTRPFTPFDGPPPPPGGPDQRPITFSVNGPVDPHTEGIRDARGAAATAQIPAQPGNGTGFAIRGGPVPQAGGLVTAHPGDTKDYAVGPVPSEVVVFQSAPPTPPLMAVGPPDGTNNQIIESAGAGLQSGAGVPPASWTDLAIPRDNIDALSFGQDYFPPGITVGLDPSSVLPDPPPGVGALPWEMRTPAAVPAYKEPVVLGDAPGISFRFSVDPWAIGAPGTAVRIQSGGADAGAGIGPWTSPGGAAGDVFATSLLKRVGGVTTGAPVNVQIRDNPRLALAPDPPPLAPMEDDLDALECVGENTNWRTGAAMLAGNVHQRVIDIGADLAAPGVSIHEPNNETPVFFSVTRNSPGAPFSAVRSQFVIDGGAAADIFVMVKEPGSPAGVGTNLLFIDESELGLYAIDATPGGSGPADYTDDLDGLILKVCPEFRDAVQDAINTLLTTHGGPQPWGPYHPGTDAYVGGGMTLSVTKFLGGAIPPGCIEVGFSVTTDAIGMVYTGVDWEAGPVAPAGGVSSAAGDVFYAVVDGAALNRNYLWYEATDLGLDAGTWVNGVSTNLANLSDNLDGLDSIDSTTSTVDVPRGAGPDDSEVLSLLSPAPQPSLSSSSLRFRTGMRGHVRLTVHDLVGRRVATLLDQELPAGDHRAVWEARDREGRAVPAGLYLIRLQMGDAVRTAKVFLRR